MNERTKDRSASDTQTTQTVGQTDRQTNKQTDGRTRTEERTHRRVVGSLLLSPVSLVFASFTRSFQRFVPKVRWSPTNLELPTNFDEHRRTSMSDSATANEVNEGTNELRTSNFVFLWSVTSSGDCVLLYLVLVQIAFCVVIVVVVSSSSSSSSSVVGCRYGVQRRHHD